MSEFLAALQSYPTVFFTGLLGVCLLYWVAVIIGALDLDLFGGHSADGPDLDAGGHGHANNSLLDLFSFGKVPIPIPLSFFALAGWGLGMFAELNLRSWLGIVLPGFLYPVVIGLALVVVALLVATALARPLRPIFAMKEEERGEKSLIGRQVKITSLKADHRFGTAVCENDGPGIIMMVVCRDGVELKRDDMAVVVEYDETKRVYLIAPFSYVDGEGRAISASASALRPPEVPPVVSTPQPPVSLERQREFPH
jgi:hypothetical protein